MASTTMKQGNPTGFVHASVLFDGAPRSADVTSSPSTIWEFSIRLLQKIINCSTTSEDFKEAAVAPAPKCKSKRRRESMSAAQLENIDVSLVERLSPKCVSIRWLDPTASNYREQRWVRRIATTAGLCALSGIPITAGEYVYGPTSRVDYIPDNRNAMILARVIE
ncbi:DUF3331 domain-containing protein [Paraburkholderia caribensis]|uniref:DUF3331 domain-containing protein n=1 Tax=Paraburkholderia caribensis TaxID=75105 RepID=UPI0034D1F834